MISDELKSAFWSVGAPKSVAESDVICCQNCFELFEPVDDDWFCPECVERIPGFELDLKKRNIQYYLDHMKDAA